MPTQALGHHHFLCDLHPERGGSRCGARAWPKNSCAPPSPAAAQPSQGRRTRLQSPWAGPPLAGKADPLPNPKRGRAAGVAEGPLPPPTTHPLEGGTPWPRLPVAAEVPRALTPARELSVKRR